MTPRGIRPIVREPALSPLELASMPGGPHCDSLLAIEEALTDSRQGVVSEVVAALRAMRQSDTSVCGRPPIDTEHYSPCTRFAGHPGPCAHPAWPQPSPPVDGWYTVHPDTAEIVLVMPTGGDRWRDVLKQIAQETDNGRPALDAAQARDLAREALDAE